MREPWHTEIEPCKSVFATASTIGCDKPPGLGPTLDIQFQSPITLTPTISVGSMLFKAHIFVNQKDLHAKASADHRAIPRKDHAPQLPRTASGIEASAIQISARLAAQLCILPSLNGANSNLKSAWPPPVCTYCPAAPRLSLHSADTARACKTLSRTVCPGSSFKTMTLFASQFDGD